MALAAACRLATDPSLPPESYPLIIPASYPAWWRQTEACSGLHGDFSRVDWRIYHRNGPFELDGVEYDGYWFGSSNRILMSLDTHLDGQVVRHEMLHALLHTGHHPREFFVNRCSGIVNCGKGCDALGEAGRGVSPSASVLQASELVVSAAVSPTAISAQRDSGWFQLIVSIRNPLDVPVWVLLSDCWSFGCPMQEYVFENDAYLMGSVAISREPRIAFRPGETRRYSFDKALLPGTYDIRANFSRGRSVLLRVVVNP